MNSNITVTTERLSPASVEVILDGAIKYAAVDGEDATLADLLNAVFEHTGQPQRVVTPDAETGAITLGDTVYVIRGGELAGRSQNGNQPVLAEDRIVVDRKHHNG